MRNIIFVFVILFISFIYVDNGIQSHVKENLQMIRSIDPNDTSFDDLSEIGAAIGDAKLVLLGEQCHGDGATFAAKSRLIKYLHEEKGFNVLAFEADFFTLNTNQEETSVHDIMYYKSLQRGINNIWSETEECDNLLSEYIPATYLTNDPLVISGFDNQFYGLLGSKRLNTFLKTYVKPSSFTKDVTHLMDDNFYNSLDTLMSSVYRTRQQLLNPSVECISLLKTLDNSLDKLLSHALSGSFAFDLQVIKNIKAFNTRILHFNDPKLNSSRDSMMSENIKWLVENKFKKEKIIVWAANSHICKQNYYITSPFNPMGSYLAQNLKKEDTYTLAFTSREGTHGVFKSSPISKPLASSLEKWIPDTVKYAFLDLKKRTDLASKTFYMRAIGHGNLKMNWQTKFDGLFYIQKMYPSTKLKR